jgi:hypothetical protein
LFYIQEIASLRRLELFISTVLPAVYGSFAGRQVKKLAQVSIFEFTLIREMDSLAPARSALRPSVSPNSFRRFPNGSSRVKEPFYFSSLRAENF